MTFIFTVTVEVERTEGKFECWDNLAELIKTELEGSDPGQLDGPDNGGTFEVTSFEVSDGEKPKPVKRTKRR